jgi:hypothetical protein
MAAHLGLAPDGVLKHWACAKVARDGDDAAVCAAVVGKLTGGGGSVRFAEIARRAWEAGRPQLATRLLDHEPRAAEQVPLLLSMQEDRLALGKAVDSGDTDLGAHPAPPPARR